MLRELGFDKGMVNIVWELATLSALVLEERFVARESIKSWLVCRVFFFFLFGLARVLSWQKCIEVMNNFVPEQDKALLLVSLPLLQKNAPGL